MKTMMDLLIGELTLNTHLKEAAHWIPYADEFNISAVRSFGDWTVYRYSVTIDTSKTPYAKALALYGRLYTAFYEYVFKLIDNTVPGRVLKLDSEKPAVLSEIIKTLRNAYKQQRDISYVEIGRGRYSSNAIFHIYLRDDNCHVDIQML